MIKLKKFSSIDIRDMREINNFNQYMTERALEMKCQAYLNGVKAELLMQTIYEFNRSKKRLDKEILKRKRSEQKLQKMTTKLRKINQQLESLCLTDPLTSIFNRRKFNEDIKTEMKRFERYGTPFSLILCDIDHFKLVNDKFGHAVGDTVLKEFSNLIKNNIRTMDILARWGGEEFILLSVETEKDEAVNLAEKLRKAIEAYPFKTVGKITSSFGVSYSKKGDKIVDIEKRTDDALYQAKNEGRNLVRCK